MKKVLITGGAGYLGSILTEMLLTKGYEVTVFDNLIYKQLSLISFCHNKKFKFIFGDVTDTNSLKKYVESNDIIIPLAAIVGMPACEKNPEMTIKVNYEQVKNIVEYSSKEQIIILPNTNSQYGSSTEIITEESPFNPLSLYAETKCDAEKFLLDSGNGIALRLATVFGTSHRMRMDLLVQDFVYKSITDGYLVLFESHFVRNYIHIRDVAKAFIHSISNFSKMKNEIYNVGLSSANLSKLELCNLISKQIENFIIKEAEFTVDPDQRNYIVSNKKIELTGYLPEFSLDNGIKELIKGYQMISESNLRNV